MVKKSSGLPDRWPHSTEADLLERPTRHIDINSEQTFEFCTNNVKTSKYEFYNFVPKFLLEEFNPRVKVANCYFLLISILQCVPIISNTNGYPTTMLPLTIVVLVNAVFQILEDLTRHQADKEANLSVTLRLVKETGLFELVSWGDLSVGDVVKVQSYGKIPADLVTLAVSEKAGVSCSGICYVETKSLDGETNLKVRQAIPLTSTLV
jgi:phospholipid-transporting ATPase